MGKVKDKTYEDYSVEKYKHIIDRYQRMVKELYGVSKGQLCRKERGDGTLTLRYARVIYSYMCFRKGANSLAVAISLNRKTRSSSLNNLYSYRKYYNSDDYFTHLADMAINWDKNN